RRRIHRCVWRGEAQPARSIQPELPSAVRMRSQLPRTSRIFTRSPGEVRKTRAALPLGFERATSAASIRAVRPSSCPFLPLPLITALAALELDFAACAGLSLSIEAVA